VHKIQFPLEVPQRTPVSELKLRGTFIGLRLDKKPFSSKTNNKMKFIAILLALVASNPNPQAGQAAAGNAAILTLKNGQVSSRSAMGNHAASLGAVNGVGFAAAFGILNAVFFPITPTSSEVYVKMWGLIQNQLSGSILAKNKAQLVQTLSTLTVNINQQITGYLSQLNLLGQTQPQITAMLNRNGGALVAPVDTVDTFMKGIDTILSASLEWYNPLTVDLAKPQAFILASAKNGICLHTKDFRIDDGTDLVADNECDLNNLSDKMFHVDENLVLHMRTEKGLKCVTYNGKDGKNMKKQLSIFSVGSDSCKKGKKITLNPQDGGFAMFDGLQNMLCIGKRKRKKNLNVIVTRQTGKKCKNNGLLIFDSMIPIILNDPKTGGKSGSTVIPSRSFEEIGIQLYFFSNIATVHLLALKELYNFGSLQPAAKAQFKNKLNDYKDWLEKVVPIYTVYSTVMNIDAKAQLEEASAFYEMLSSASLDAKPVLWNPATGVKPLPEQEVQRTQQQTQQQSSGNVEQQEIQVQQQQQVQTQSQVEIPAQSGNIPVISN
jgi:hypothetical protein